MRVYNSSRVMESTHSEQKLAWYRVLGPDYAKKNPSLEAAIPPEFSAFHQVQQLFGHPLQLDLFWFHVTKRVAIVCHPE